MKIKQKCIGNTQQEQLLCRGLQRWMGWKSEKTILCYDHSFTEREAEETFAAFQSEAEQEQTLTQISSRRGAARPIPKQEQQPLQSAAVRQAIADLAFWKDEP